MEVLYSKEGQTELSDDMKTNIRCNALHFFRVLGECRAAFTHAAQQPQDVGIMFFNMYMVQEHFVGRHDPAAVISWQKENPDRNLRTLDVFTLGEVPCVIPATAQWSHTAQTGSSLGGTTGPIGKV